MKYELVGSWLIADGQTILFPGSRRDLKALAELVRRANAYDGLLATCKEQADGGPAFPFPGVEGVWPAKEGMSLWDYMAGQAMAGLLASGEHTDCTPAEYAHDAYNYADAMLAEKRRREGGAS